MTQRLLNKYVCQITITTETANKSSSGLSDLKLDYHIVDDFLMQLGYWQITISVWSIKLKTKLRGLSPRANYTDRAAAAGRRS